MCFIIDNHTKHAPKYQSKCTVCVHGVNGYILTHTVTVYFILLLPLKSSFAETCSFMSSEEDKL